MFGRILVPLDGTPQAESALPYAEILARRGDQRLVLLRVAPPHHIAGRDPDDTAARVATAEAYLDAHARVLQSRGIAVAPVVSYGEPTQWISHIAHSRRVGLIVMAVRHLASWAYGSAARTILDTTSAPLLLVPAGHLAETPTLDTGARLLVPLNGSPFAETALPIAARLATMLAGNLLLLRAVAPEPSALARAANSYLDHLARQTQTATLPVDFTVQPGTPTEVIAAATRASSADLVIMTTHGPAERSEVERLRSGSTTEATFRQGGVPLLLVRAGTTPSAVPEQRRLVTTGLPFADTLPNLPTPFPPGHPLA